MSSQPKWPSQISAPDPAKRPSILYVEEDEAFFRRAKEALEHAGYGVMGASSGWQALALLLKTPARVVLGGDALCGTDAAELIARMKQIQPGVAVIICSRNLPHSMKGVDAFVSAHENFSHLLSLLRQFLAK